MNYPLTKLEIFEKEISYSFKEKGNIILALTHSSYSHETKLNKLENNERLEFLGDSILNMVISEFIFLNLKKFSEGELTKIRANIVCEYSLSICANKLKLGEYILLSKGEQLTGGSARPSILSDAFEAIIGALYIDGGINIAKNFILTHLQDVIDSSINGLILLDYKTLLQEVIQKNNEQKITYKITDEKGPDHNKQFFVCVSVNENTIGEGQGKSKKEAEQLAAKQALENRESWQKNI